MGIVSTAVTKFRTSILIMIFCVLAGILGRASMPIASNPNVTFPWVNVVVTLAGASPEDMARLVAKPIENRFLRLEGQEEVFSVSGQSYTYVRVKYDIDYDIDQAILDVERAVGEVRNQLPPEAEDPRVVEYADNDQPILVYSISGFSNLRAGYQVAKNIEERLEKVPGVLEISVDGVPEIANAVRFNNVLIPAGFQDTGSGRFAVEIPSVFETSEDVYNLPIKASGSKVVKLGDVAQIKRTFKDPSSFSRVNGKDAITLSIKKRVGFNELDIANTVREQIDGFKSELPQKLLITPGLDTTQFAGDMVNELQLYTMGIPLKNGDVYKLYCDVFPKESRPAFMRYIKGKKEKKYDEFLLNIITEYYHISKLEATDYLDILYLSKEGKSELKDILQKYGTDPQIIKKFKLGK